MISLTRPAISRPARDAPCGDVLPRVSITRYRTISPKSPTGSNSEPQSGHRSPIGSAWQSVLYKRVKHAQTIEIRHRQTPLLAARLRRVRVARIARTDRGCPGRGAVRFPGVQAS